MSYLEVCSAGSCQPIPQGGEQPAATESFGAPLFLFDAAADFRLAGATGNVWPASATGEVQVIGTLYKEPTADDVVATIRKNDEVIHRLELAAADAGDFDVTTSIAVERVELIQIGDDPREEDSWQQEGDLLTFHLESDHQVDPNRVRWTPTVTYEGGLYCRRPIREGDPEICGSVTCVEDPTTGKTACTLNGDSDSLIPILPEEVTQPVQVLHPVHRMLPRKVPTRFWEAPSADTFEIDVEWTEPEGSTAPVVVFLQGVHRLIDKRRLVPGAADGDLIFRDGFETGDVSRWGAAPAPAHNRKYSVTVDLAAGERLYVTVLAAEAADLGTLRVATEVDGKTVELPHNLRYREDGTCDSLHGPCDPLAGGYYPLPPLRCQALRRAFAGGEGTVLPAPKPAAGSPRPLLNPR